MHRAATDTLPLSPVQPRRGLKQILWRLVGFREAGIVAIILAIGVAMSIRRPGCMSLTTIHMILLGVAVESIIAIGMTALLVSGGFDLSVGSTLVLSSMTTAWLMGSCHFPIAVSVAAGLAVGTLVGVINGLIIAKVGINPFITTLAMMGIARGLVMGLARQNISGLPDSFKRIGQNFFFGVQYPILIALAMIVIGDLLLRKSRFFRQSYYIGGNEKAAVLSGIAVDRMKIFNYALTGFLSALAGIVMAARFDCVDKMHGTGMELKVITAVIIGGASLQGGEGTVFGAFLGLVLMAMIDYALNEIGNMADWQMLVIGATLLLAVIIDTLGKKIRQAKRV